MEKFLAFLKEWDTVLVFFALPLLLIPIEILAELINTKNKKSPLYWLDKLFTTIIKVFYRRFQK